MTRAQAMMKDESLIYSHYRQKGCAQLGLMRRTIYKQTIDMNDVFCSKLIYLGNALECVLLQFQVLATDQNRMDYPWSMRGR
jgi:hypothetical protein